MGKINFSEIKSRAKAIIHTRFADRLGKRRLCFLLSACVCLVIFFVLYGIANHLADALDTQNMVSRWAPEGGYAQVSCFFSVNSGVTMEAIEEFSHNLEDALKEASIENENGENSRLFVYAYSADGMVEVQSERGKLTAQAVGAGGDFFLFHRLDLINGSFFSGNDVMQDYCVIDEDAAWQLFGSNDVAGKMVYVGGVPHIVTGVIKRADDKLSKAAGLSETLVYVSYESLSEYGINNGINHFEIVMPNPVSGFAASIIKEKMDIDEKYIEIIENSRRFEFENRLKCIGGFFTRAMNGRGIIYPYWENVARGYEDIITFITFIALLFLVYALVIFIWLIIFLWRHKGYTVGDVFGFIKGKIEDVRDKRYQKAYYAGESNNNDENNATEGEK